MVRTALFAFVAANVIVVDAFGDSPPLVGERWNCLEACGLKCEWIELEDSSTTYECRGGELACRLSCGQLCGPLGVSDHFDGDCPIAPSPDAACNPLHSHHSPTSTLQIM